ncbi:MAG TPA: S8 family serine peptidase, partial [Roseiflexaceae bacterium]|nr:S8 family serine peptidase [Roseiflexaceae bacterium]
MHHRTMLHRLASLLLVGLVALGGAASAVAQQGGSGFSATPLDPAGQEHTAAIKGATLPMAPAAVAEQAAAIGSGADKRVSVIVKLDVDSLAAYEGGLPGLPATSPRVTGAPALDATAPASRLYLDYVAQEIDTFASTAKASLSSAVITHRYDVVVGGVTMIVRADEVEALAALPGVQAIYPDTLQQLETDTSPQFIGAQSTWDQLGGQGSAGEGVIVGVLDTGIWPEHPSLADPDPLGKPYAPPPPAPDGDRQCEFSGGANPGAPFTCNNKLIGADRFMATYDAVIGLLPTEFTTARDDNGHGTHTSTTAAGNRGVQASIFGIPRGTISGIAPRAHVIMYKVCGDQGCFTSDSAAAVQEAIQDGVNVINFSISGGTSPYADAVSLAFLDAYAAGVFVAASAGNTGPGADTVNHREPWVTTVAASVTNRHFLSTVTLTAAGGATLQLTGATITPGISTPTPVVNAADPPFNDPLCLEDGPDNAFAGVVVVCERGVIGRLQKSSNVAQRGAAGMLLYNAIPQGLNTDNHWVPSVHLESDAGAALLDFLEANSGELVTFTAGEATRVQGDVMAPFSSRGGPGQTLGVNKPDVTAPGVQILAGHSAAPATRLGGPPGELFQSIQGTSMSSPHVAGAAALLKDAFPTFTPGQIKSALMTTARTNGLVKEDGATPFTPFDAGSGRIDLHRAWDPGITFAESAANFVALQSQLWHANLPSLYVPVMPGRVTVQRTAQDVTGAAASYTTGVLYPQNQPRDFTVTVPASLGIAANGTHTFAITVDARDVPLGEVRHATIVFSGDNGRTARFPVTIVRRQPAITLEKSCAPATIARGSATTCSITMANTTFDPAPVSMSDTLPRELRLVSSSITGGASPSGNGVAFSGTLFGASPPNVAVGPGTSPAGGYL